MTQYKNVLKLNTKKSTNMVIWKSILTNNSTFVLGSEIFQTKKHLITFKNKFYR